DGVRDFHVTGFQTCALPICGFPAVRALRGRHRFRHRLGPDRPRRPRLTAPRPARPPRPSPVFPVSPAPRSTVPMRIGILGLGRIGAFHAETLSALDTVDSLVVSDPYADAAKAAAERFGAQVADS